MISPIDSSRTTIQRMTMRWLGPQRDAHTPATALRVENLLNQADWRPRAMQPGEILLIRRFSLPAALRTNQFTLHGWDASLTDALDAVYRTAVRPRPGTALSQANALLFEDAVALLLSLTSEVLAARSSELATQAWYWPQVMGSEWVYTTSALLGAVWSRYAAQVPAALAYMSAQQTQQACAVLSHADARRVWQTLASVYALPLPSALLARADEFTVNDIHPPWQRWLSTERAGLGSKTTQLLLGVCAVLHRAPAHARSAKFMAQVGAWWQGSQTSVAALDKTHLTHSSVSDVDDLPRLVASTSPITADAERTPTNAPAPIHVDKPKQRHIEASATEATSPISDALVTMDEHAAHEQQGPEKMLGEPSVARLAGVKTQLGGVFFLVNVLKQLKLPDDLDASTSGWDVITLLAWRLLDQHAQTDTYADDPIWAVLRHLANREANFIDKTNESSINGRVNKPGFSEKPGLFTLVSSVFDVPIGLSEWLTRGVEFVCQQLTHEDTADEGPSRFSSSPAAILLCKAGTVNTSRTHVDMYFPMHTADTRLRQVGLDANPGWVPDLGYIIQFHFDLDEKNS